MAENTWARRAVSAPFAHALCGEGELDCGILRDMEKQGAASLGAEAQRRGQLVFSLRFPA